MILLYGIELYIFFSPDYTTVFISKADTTGQKLPGKTKISYLDITRSILEYLVASHKTNPNEKMIDKSEIPLRICLFTRPEKQYLFPLSAPPESTDGSKHLMNGTQLVEWWIKCLEPIVGKMESAKARLEMPGSETRVIDNIINNRQNWAKGVIFGESANTSGSGNEDEKAHETTDHEKVASDFSISRNKAAIYHIPRFPDDPKARFLDYMMYEEKRDLKTSLMNFWIELQGRQEFLLGAVTGIIGIEGYYRKGVESQQSVRQAEIDQKDDDLALSYKDFKNLREIVTTSDYSTRELVIDAYDELIATEPGFTRMEITGTKRDMETSKTANPVGAQSRAVNNLTGLVRRKRVNDEITGQGKDCNGSVNILTDNLIKKKAKN
ncbi:hypothetical protein NADFUDRAFT_82926 [Nadsonia fulvescens var. elongata DSM 6958]|uniref:histone acetyltransferase n=1 Tax=Nadsonia fulvescens var. elongata DSM 6958 TaxID=857566 RepID=A0A1E3PKW3_9ASCO|nr:hypothetical protein NADFUDRAFT_82926 [Nadsonia fulvescens var. elongata DSM 6958]